MSKNYDASYWTERYEDGRTGWDLGAPSRPLMDYCEQLDSKSLSILIPGAGMGYEAEALWNAGFKHVHVVDLSESPLQNLKSRLPDFPQDQLIQADFFEMKGKYNLILEQTFFCALDPSLRPAYARHMHSMLAEGGKLVGVFFDFPLTEKGPPFGGSEEEFRNHLSPYFEIHTLDRCYNSMPGREGKELFLISERKKNPA